MLCVCARGGTSFAWTNDICDTAAAIIGWNEICVYKTQPIDWTIIRCSDIKLYWSLSVNFRYSKRSPLWNCVNCQSLSNRKKQERFCCETKREFEEIVLKIPKQKKQKVECIKTNWRKSYFIEFNKREKQKQENKSKCSQEWVQVLSLLVLFSPSSASIAANHRHLLHHALYIPVSVIL